MLELGEFVSDRLDRRDAPARPKRVLIVEDDCMNAAALRSIFTRKGCDVAAANTLKDAMAMLEARRDYIVLDLVLPDGDGLEILKHIRARQPAHAAASAATVAPRVIVTTAVSDARRIREVLELQPHRLLRKPIDLVDLLNAIGMM